jgi:hypothetical protein
MIFAEVNIEKAYELSDSVRIAICESGHLYSAQRGGITTLLVANLWTINQDFVRKG